MSQVDGSLEFSAAGDYIRRTTNLPASTAFTLAGWVKVGLKDASTQCLAGLDSSGNYDYVEIETNNLLYARSFAEGGGETYGSWSAGTWYFIAITSTTAGANSVVVRLWNSAGSLLHTSDVQGQSFTPDQLNIGGGIYSATVSAGTRFSYWRCWTAALSQGEIEAEMFSRTPVRTSGLDSALNNADGTDESGNGRHWTLNSITASSDYPDVFPPAGNPPALMGQAIF